MSADRVALAGYAANVLLPLGLTGLGVVAFYSSALRQVLIAYVAHRELELRYLHLLMTGRRLLQLQVSSSALLLLLAIVTGSVWPLLPLIALMLGPTLWLSRARARRTIRVEEQLDTWLLALANALRASPSLGDAIDASSTLVAAPLAEELALLIKENGLGVPLDRALQEMTARIGSPVVAAAVATLCIARNTGGDLSSTLETSAASLREMARLEGVVRTKTAEGRSQAAVICVIPGPLVYLLHTIDPGLLQPLWETKTGHLVVAAALLLWGTALMLARKIVAVEI